MNLLTDGETARTGSGTGARTSSKKQERRHRSQRRLLVNKSVTDSLTLSLSLRHSTEKWSADAATTSLDDSRLHYVPSPDLDGGSACD